MKLMNIYFNRCFTQTSKIIELIQSNDEGRKFKIFISHSTKNNYLESVSDYFEVEPQVEQKELKGEAYVNYCLNFCKTHEIDIFIPRNQVTTLIKYKQEFEKIGVKTMFIGDFDAYDILNDKIKTAEILKDTNVVLIPLTFKIDNINDYQSAYAKIKETGSSACMKPIVGIGGNGFKKISEDISELSEIYNTNAFTISKEHLDKVLSSNDKIEPFLMSEYMEDNEYSIDCLSKNGELVIAVPRRKVDRYRQNIEYVEKLIEISRRVTKFFNLSYLYNIQVKYHHGKIYLIEVNTRMSGGLHKACLTGVNFPYLAIKLLLDEKIELPKTINYNFQLYVTNDFEIKQL